MRRDPRLVHVASLVAGVSLGLGGVAATAVSPTVDSAGESILFIGNSLTESNGLPARGAEIATAAGHSLRTSAVTAPGASLLDHWEDGRDLHAIRGARWSVVVLQQGPSTLPESRAELIASTRQFAAEIRAVACMLHAEDQPSLARAVAASVLRLDAGRRDLLVDAACSAAAARR